MAAQQRTRPTTAPATHVMRTPLQSTAELLRSKVPAPRTVLSSSSSSGLLEPTTSRVSSAATSQPSGARTVRTLRNDIIVSEQVVAPAHHSSSTLTTASAPVQLTQSRLMAQPPTVVSALAPQQQVGVRQTHATFAPSTTRVIHPDGSSSLVQSPQQQRVISAGGVMHRHPTLVQPATTTVMQQPTATLVQEPRVLSILAPQQQAGVRQTHATFAPSTTRVIHPDGSSSLVQSPQQQRVISAGGVMHRHPTLVQPAMTTLVHSQPTVVHSQPTLVHSQPTLVHSQPTLVHSQPHLLSGHTTYGHMPTHVVQVLRDGSSLRSARRVAPRDESDDGYLYSPEYYQDWQEYYYNEWQMYYSRRGESKTFQVAPPPKSKIREKQDGKWFEYVRNKGAKGPGTSKFTQEAPAMPTHDRSLTSAGAVRAEYYPK